MSKVPDSNDYAIRPIISIKDLLNSSVELYGDRPAYLVKKKKGEPYSPKTYAQLKKDVDALGTMLLDMGLKNEKIAIIGENCYSWIVAYYATVNGTGTVVPMDKELSKEEVYNLLRTADCKAVFYTETYEPYFKDFPIPHKILMKVYEGAEDRTDNGDKGERLIWSSLVAEGQKLLDQGNRDFIDAEIDPEEVKILLFTSGTTDDAKAVMLCHKNIAENIMSTCKVVEIFPDDRTLSILPIHHTFECTLGQLLMNYRGATAAYCEGLKYVTKNMEEAGTTVLIGVPLIFESIYDKIWKQAEKTGKAATLKKAIAINRKCKSVGIDLSRILFKKVHQTFGGKIRLFITGAAAINPNVLRGFEDLGIRVLQGYGLTECSPLVTGNPFYENTYKKAGSAGKVIMNGELKIVDPDEDGIGEIVYRGPNVMLGYYNMPEKTAEVLKDGWFYTGDLGFLDKEGWLYITGRKKNVIVTKTGKNIYPEEVEHYLNSSRYIQESLVFGSLDNGEEDTLVSAQIRPDYDVIEEEFGGGLDDNKIYDILKEEIRKLNIKMPIYKRVKNIILRKDEFIKTTTKKIKRHQNNYIED